ncbi:MAG: PqqD family protein [Anaerolineales bacterium]|nr:PqqD family protein [Anaerolineales bacterium]
MTTSEKIYQLKPDAVFQPLDDEAIIVSLNSEEIFKLNLPGMEILKLVEAKVPLAEILTVLAKRFDVAGQEFEQDVVELLDQLLKAGLIEEVKTP